MIRSLTDLEGLRRAVMKVRWMLHTRIWRMNIHESAIVSLKAHLDKTYPRGLHIGERSYVAFGAVILTHDRTRGLYVDTVIGRNCFIGARSIVMPGVHIGDNCIVGAGAVVTKNVPERSVVAGNPAIIVQHDVDVIEYGRLRKADATTLALKAAGRIKR